MYRLTQVLWLHFLIAVLRALLASSSFLARNNDCRCKPAALGFPLGVLLGFKPSQSGGPCLPALRGACVLMDSPFGSEKNRFRGGSRGGGGGGGEFGGCNPPFIYCNAPSSAKQPLPLPRFLYRA